MKKNIKKTKANTIANSLEFSKGTLYTARPRSSRENLIVIYKTVNLK